MKTPVFPEKTGVFTDDARMGRMALRTVRVLWYDHAQFCA